MSKVLGKIKPQPAFKDAGVNVNVNAQKPPITVSVTQPEEQPAHDARPAAATLGTDSADEDGSTTQSKPNPLKK